LLTDELMQRGLVASGGVTPVEVLMRNMVDLTAERETRIQCAIALMPYYHKRQAQAVEVDLTMARQVSQQLELVYGIDDDNEAEDRNPVGSGGDGVYQLAGAGSGDSGAGGVGQIVGGGVLTHAVDRQRETLSGWREAVPLDHSSQHLSGVA
jgi:hypothetical protein